MSRLELKPHVLAFNQNRIRQGSSINLDSEVEVRQAVWSAAIYRRSGDRILAGSGSLLPGIP